MFSSGNTYVMIWGILLALAFIALSVWYVSKKLASEKPQEKLIDFVLTILAALVALFIVDKTLAFKVQLLTPEQSNSLFSLIKDSSLMIFAYFFGKNAKDGHS